MAKILVVDDEAGIRRIIASQLEAGGHTVLGAAGAASAEAVLAETSVDLVLCDIKMKDEDGLALVALWSKRHPRLKVIVVTGFIDKEHRDLAQAAGCFDYLIKPLRREKLLGAVRSALEKGGTEGAAADSASPMGSG